MDGYKEPALGKKIITDPEDPEKKKQIEVDELAPVDIDQGILKSFEGMLAYLDICADPRDVAGRGSMKLGLSNKFKKIAETRAFRVPPRKM